MRQLGLMLDLGGTCSLWIPRDGRAFEDSALLSSGAGKPQASREHRTLRVVRSASSGPAILNIATLVDPDEGKPE
ncbi:hypothetical protein HOI83_00020 [Candidatus Uhrbacteria bacterium]|jgi:hypothetical protein|nr:hypothetical protein [Candidatus Uhrbacteria bacterium]